MFTGLVEGVGKVVRMAQSSDAGKLHLNIGDLANDVKTGGSVAVNGACLTAVQVSGGIVEFDASAETLRVTTLGALRTGDVVNIERPLRVGDRLGGHFVLGHVDAVGTVAGVRKTNAQVAIEIAAPQDVVANLIPKGSIAVDGISLTIASITDSGFSVVIIPHTLGNTTLESKAAGDRVNLELDVIGKYVARLLAQTDRQGRTKSSQGMTTDFLSEHGFG